MHWIRIHIWDDALDQNISMGWCTGSEYIYGMHWIRIHLWDDALNQNTSMVWCTGSEYIYGMHWIRMCTRGIQHLRHVHNSSQQWQNIGNMLCNIWFLPHITVVKLLSGLLVVITDADTLQPLCHIYTCVHVSGEFPEILFQTCNGIA